MKYYIASCVFTAQNPELSKKIRDYVESNYRDIKILRCCTPSWKVKTYEERMPEGTLREEWTHLEHSKRLQPGDEVWSLCHNCTNIVEEFYPGTVGHSLWELIDADADLPFPYYSGMKVTVQDCWRFRDRAEEQEFF